MQSVLEFLERYRASWQAVIRGETSIETMDGFFHLPSLMVSVDGVPTLYETAEAVRRFNVTRQTAFAEGGGHTAQFRGIDTVSQGPHVVLAIVNWELLRADGSIERAWRHYYTILTTPEPAIAISAFQTGS